MLMRLVTLVRGWVGCPSTVQSTPTVVTRSKAVKPSLAQFGQPSPQAVRKPRQPVAQPSLKKPKAVSQTTAAKEGQSKKRKPVATAKQPSTRGKSTRTPALLTPQAVKPAPKRKA